jgi:hypothetical protein
VACFRERPTDGELAREDRVNEALDQIP